MSRHRMADGRLLQMNKSYGQLKQKQKEKISEVQGQDELERFNSLEALVGHYPEFDSFLIDMAVGLRSGADQLRPDDLARKELGTRSSSIFPIPCRQAVYAGREEEKKATFDRLEAYCERAGQTKTVAIERALNKLIDEYDDMIEAYESRKAGGDK